MSVTPAKRGSKMSLIATVASRIQHSHGTLLVGFIALRAGGAGAMRVDCGRQQKRR
jgi:hypothetical protein